MADEEEALRSTKITVPMDMEATIDVDAEDLALRVRAVDLLNLIDQIDDEVGSFYFTELLYRMALDKRQVQCKERPEIADMEDREVLRQLMKEEDE